jgi:hypothetical protein
MVHCILKSDEANISSLVGALIGVLKRGPILAPIFLCLEKWGILTPICQIFLMSTKDLTSPFTIIHIHVCVCFDRKRQKKRNKYQTFIFFDVISDHISLVYLIKPFASSSVRNI